MTHAPHLIAYAITDRPGDRSSWLRIGAAFTRGNKPGLTLLLNAMPLGGRIVLIEPRERFPATFFPSSMPLDLATRPALRAEKQVWQALRQAPLPPGTLVLYNRAPKGCWRRADILILHPERGIIAMEVKGGRLHYYDGFRQRLAGPHALSKRIEPWAQSKRALAQALARLHLNPLLIPQASILAMPDTSADVLPFPSGPHMLTAEELAPAHLARKLEALLPRLDPAGSATLAPALESLTKALTVTANRNRP